MIELNVKALTPEGNKALNQAIIEAEEYLKEYDPYKVEALGKLLRFKIICKDPLIYKINVKDTLYRYAYTFKAFNPQALDYVNKFNKYIDDIEENIHKAMALNNAIRNKDYIIIRRGL